MGIHSSSKQRTRDYRGMARLSCWMIDRTGIQAQNNVHMITEGWLGWVVGWLTGRVFKLKTTYTWLQRDG